MDLSAANIKVCRSGKLILDPDYVSFRAQAGKLTAIIGPNGAGKTTLMRALSGERPDGGQVMVDDREDIYDQPEYWLQQIGYVPVDNILHDQLPLREALLYIGRLRLSTQSLAQIEATVDRLLTDFDFPAGDERRRQQIKSLSSGERKRANICSELIIDPPILMLDEPTSNLDPDAEHNLMSLLASYAETNSKTILVITHTLNTIKFCHEVIFVANSRIAAHGTPDEVLAQLESHVHPEGATPFDRWARVFAQNKTHPDRPACRADATPRRERPALQVAPAAATLATARSGGQPAPTLRQSARQAQGTGAADSAASNNAAHTHKAVSWSNQLRFLLSRYMKVRLGDKWNLLGTLLAGLSGVLFFTLPGKTFVKPYDENEIGLALNQARQSVYVVALVVTLIGLITSYTEVSKEFHIYRHERLKGLSASAYFMSKWIWLALAVGVWAPILLLLFIVLIYGQPLPGFPEPRIGQVVGGFDALVQFQLVGLLTQQASWLILITLILASIASVTLGLLISVLAGGSARGYLLLSFAVVFIVLFSGLLQNKQLEQLVDTFSVASTGRWAYEGVSSSIGIYCWLDGWRFAEFNSTGHIVSVWLALIAFTLLAAFIAIVALRIRDPWYSLTTNLRRVFVNEWQRVALPLAVVILILSYTVFLRDRSYEYHELNYWSRQEYGGSNAYQYGNVYDVANPDTLQILNGTISASWCGG